MLELVTITASDIAVLEKLTERTFSPALKAALLDIFGDCGRRETIWEMQEEISRDCMLEKACGACGLCSPYREDPLLDQILYIINHPDEEVR